MKYSTDVPCPMSPVALRSLATLSASSPDAIVAVALDDIEIANSSDQAVTLSHDLEE
jgi:hypothetical protein